ncbi:MAG TPA: nucleoside triphosphate pyrophosphatase [Polyangiales bacterium]|nr:nucleoside triphosphate pyrophosphatase [Polyangiales bacterium]
MPALVLASTSVYRQQLLTRLGIPFTAAAPTCDEEALKDPSLLPRDLAAHLARAKVQSIAASQREAHVLGSDQLVEIASEVLGKPGTSERALEQLTLLAGKAHRLITAFALVCPDGTLIEHVDVHTLHMRSLTRAELERYIAADRPLDCAGSYKIEERGIALFERIEGADFSAITGLPLIALTTALRTRGFLLP